jgi:type IV secretory pathway TrbL component
MHTLLYYASTITALGVAVVLMFGLWTMKTGKSPNLSQKLMRWRVGLQFFAIVLIVAYALVKHYMN